METQTANPQGLGQSSPASAMAQPAVLPPPDSQPSKSTPEQRAAWRAKHAERRAKAKAAKTGALAVDPLPETVASIDSVVTEAPAPVRVLWCGGMLSELTDLIVEETEKNKISTLKEEAAKIHPMLVAKVEKDAPWPVVPKTTLKRTAPEVIAKWLNYFGIGAENAPEALLATAIGAIWASNSRLSAELKELAEKYGPKPDAKPAPAPAP